MIEDEAYRYLNGNQKELEREIQDLLQRVEVLEKQKSFSLPHWVVGVFIASAAVAAAIG